MAGHDIAPGEIDQSKPVEKEGRRRFWPLALLPLLLLLIVVAVIADTFIDRQPDRAVFIARNIECVQCHTEMIPDLDLYSVHSPFALQECTVCHAPHANEIERTLISGRVDTIDRVRTVIEWLPLSWILAGWDTVTGVIANEEAGRVIARTTKPVPGEHAQLIAPVDELCWICHGDLGPELTMSAQHAPFTDGNCLDCHNPHASEWSGMLTQDPRDLCMTCHGSLAEEMARAQQHEPVAQRLCMDCHDPHASDHQGILIDRQTVLCFSCHVRVAGLSNMPVQHQPFQYDDCTGCHEPHGSDYEPLLIDAEPRVCYLCHEYTEAEFGRMSIHPVGTAELNCSSCHDPHASLHEGLLTARDNEACYQCHGEIRAVYEPSEHAQVLCIRCHAYHGSDYQPLLRAANPDVCLTCHADIEEHDNQHPVRPVYYDVQAGTPMTCTSTCHGPHGTEYDMMLRYYPWPLDGGCLQCHSRVGLDF